MRPEQWGFGFGFGEKGPFGSITWSLPRPRKARPRENQAEKAMGLRPRASRPGRPGLQAGGWDRRPAQWGLLCCEEAGRGLLRC